MSVANEWLELQKQNDRSTPRWEAKGAFSVSAKLYYRGPGSAALVKLTSGTDLLVLAPVDAVSLGKWLLEMYGEER